MPCSGSKRNISVGSPGSAHRQSNSITRPSTTNIPRLTGSKWNLAGVVVFRYSTSQDRIRKWNSSLGSPPSLGSTTGPSMEAQLQDGARYSVDRGYSGLVGSSFPGRDIVL